MAAKPPWIGSSRPDCAWLAWLRSACTRAACSCCTACPCRGQGSGVEGYWSGSGGLGFRGLGIQGSGRVWGSEIRGLGGGLISGAVIQPLLAPS